MRTTILSAALLIGLAACSSAAVSDAPGTSATATDLPSTAALSVDLADFMIDPSDLETPGPIVAIDVTNDGPTPHNLTVRDASGEVRMATEDLGADESATITGELEAGEYTIYCSLAGHVSLGMTGTLTVTDS